MMSGNDKYYEYGIAHNATRVWEGPGQEPRCECGHLWQFHGPSGTKLTDNCFFWMRGGINPRPSYSTLSGNRPGYWCSCEQFIIEKQHTPGRYARKHVKIAEEKRAWWEAEKLRRRAEWQADIEAEIADLKGEK